VLGAYLAGDNQICSMVQVPTPDEEDGKRIHREREHLVQDRTRLENRILALFATQGIRSRPSLRNWERDLAALETGDGRKLPPRLAAEINRLRRRLGLVLDLIRAMAHLAVSEAMPQGQGGFFDLNRSSLSLWSSPGITNPSQPRDLRQHRSRCMDTANLTQLHF
jgi:hypothetical protein